MNPYVVGVNHYPISKTHSAVVIYFEDGTKEELVAITDKLEVKRGFQWDPAP